MSTARTIGEGIAWSTMSATLGKALILGNVFLILSQLSVYEYGLTELTMSVVSIFTLLMFPGLTAIVTADLGVERARGAYGKMKALFLEFVRFNLVLGGITWAVLFFGSSFVAHVTGNALINDFFKIVSFLFILSPLRSMCTMMAVAFVRYADQSLFSVVEECAKTFWLVVMFFFFDRGADGVLFSIVFAQVMAILIFAPRTLSAIRTFWGAESESVVPLWMLLREHRKWGVAASYIGTITQNARLWLIKVLLGTEAVGLFSFALGIVTQIGSLFNISSVIGTLLPTLIHDRAKVSRVILRMTRYQIFIGIFVIAVSTIFAPVLVHWFFPEYAGSKLLLILLLPIILTGLIKGLHLTVFVALKKQRGWFFIESARLLVLITVLPIGIMMFGISGIALEVVISNILIMFERWRALKKILPNVSLNVYELFRMDPVDKKIVMFVRNHIDILWSGKNRAKLADFL